MVTQRATLRVTSETPVEQVVARLVADLALAGIANPSLAQLVGDAAGRIQQELNNGALNGQAVLRVPGVIVTVTTRPPGLVQRLLARVNPYTEVYS